MSEEEMEGKEDLFYLTRKFSFHKNESNYKIAREQRFAYTSGVTLRFNEKYLIIVNSASWSTFISSVNKSIKDWLN